MADTDTRDELAMRHYGCKYLDLCARRQGVMDSLIAVQERGS